MHLHPMIELSNDREVRQAKGFKDAAAGLTGEELARLYETELANAPRRTAVGKKFLVKAKPPTSRRAHKDEEHLSLALLKHCRDSGEGLALPSVGNLDLLAAQVPLATASVDRSMGDADPNKGVGKIDLLGVGPEDRLVVVKLKFAAPGATRGGTGDTPLRAFLDGLAQTAIASANRESLASELAAAQERTLSDRAPDLRPGGKSPILGALPQARGSKGRSVDQRDREARPWHRGVDRRSGAVPGRRPRGRSGLGVRRGGPGPHGGASS